MKRTFLLLTSLFLFAGLVLAVGCAVRSDGKLEASVENPFRSESRPAGQ